MTSKKIVQSQYFTKIQMASSVHSAITNVLYEQVWNPNKLIFFFCYLNILSQDLGQVKLQDCHKSGITTQVQKQHAYFSFTAFH